MPNSALARPLLIDYCLVRLVMAYYFIMSNCCVDISIRTEIRFLKPVQRERATELKVGRVNIPPMFLP